MKWWKKSILEGLKYTGQTQRTIPFEMVYWAHYLHPKPLNPRIKDEKHPLCLSSPYLPNPNVEKNENGADEKLKGKILDVLEDQMDKIFLNEDMSLNFSGITDLMIKHFFNDLNKYYMETIKNSNGEQQLVKDVLRNNLARVLEKHQKKKICLIAHSMGSIIAYDVLTQTLPDISIDTFITIGSPLGIPVVISRIAKEQKKRKVKTPDSVTRNWINLSDLGDKVAMNYNLADDYWNNKRKIKVIDKTVFNNYEANGKRNPHKSYGYLRTPEIAETIHKFLNQEEARRKNKLVQIIKKFFLVKIIRNKCEANK